MIHSNNVPHRRRRTRSRLAIAAATVSMLAILAGLLITHTGIPRVRPHTGDGSFRNVSWRFPWQSVGLPVTGYSIHFPRFDLEQSFEATYQFTDLPNLGKPAVIYLCIHDPAAGAVGGYVNRVLTTANFIFELRDDSGSIVAGVDRPLSKMTRTNEGGQGCWGFYDPDHSPFYSRQSSQYRLHVRYTADSELSVLQGFVFIRCGGSI